MSEEKRATLHEVCMAYVNHVLRQNGGNKSLTARQLDIPRRSLYRWVSGERGRKGQGRAKDRRLAQLKPP